MPSITEKNDVDLVKILYVFLVLGIVLNIWVFFIPYNFISDEDEYINEVLTFAIGSPQGWNIRSFVYPIILSNGVFIAKAFGVDSPEGLILAIRLTNWILHWLCIGLTYLVGKQVYNKSTGLLAAVILLFSWLWIILSKRVMMDVPAAAWLLASIYFVNNDLKKSSNVIFAVTAAALSFFTKFQMGYAAFALGSILIFHPTAKGARLRNFFIATATAILMIGIFAFTDWLVYGKPFISLIESYHYVTSTSIELMKGACTPITYYLENISQLYSYFFPALIVVGFLVSAIKIHRSLPILIILAVHIFFLHFTCVKHIRYYITMAPLMSLIGAYALVGSIMKAQLLLLRNGYKFSSAYYQAGFIALLVIIIVSFIPRNEIRSIVGMEETCWSFVYQLKDQPDSLPENTKLLLTVPCETPSFFLGPMTLGYATRDISEHEYSQKLAAADVVVLEKDSFFEKRLLQAWGPAAVMIAQSPKGLYRAYRRGNN